MENNRVSLSPRQSVTEIKQKGKKIWLTPWLLLFIICGLEKPSKLYFSLNGRFLNAVRRNRIKRVLRAVWQQLGEGCCGYVVLVRKLKDHEITQFKSFNSVKISQLVKKFKNDSQQYTE